MPRDSHVVKDGGRRPVSSGHPVARPGGFRAAVVSAGRAHGPRALRLLPLSMIAAIVAATYGAIVWTLARGFDWSDEGFVVAMTASDRNAVDEPWGFQHLLHPLYVLTGESVLSFRVLRLVGYVLLAVALVAAARSVMLRIGLDLTRSGWVLVLLLAQVGTFMAWAYPPHYLGYNELGAWLAQLGVALALLSLARGVSPGDARSVRGLWAIWVALGTVTTLLLFAKATSGGALAAGVVVLIAAPNPNLTLRRRLAALVSGTAATFLVLWAVGCPISSYLGDLRTVVSNPSAQEALGHPLTQILHSHVGSVLATGTAVLVLLVVFVLAVAGLVRSRIHTTGAPGADRTDRVVWILGLAVTFALLALPRTDTWDYLADLIVFIGMAGLVGLTILGGEGAGIRRGKLRRSTVIIGALAIAAAPFISSVGTNNRITGQFIFSATLWAVVFGVALALLGERASMLGSGARRVPTLLALVVVFLSAWAVKSDIGSPYRTDPLLSQTTPTSVPELRGILVTAPEAAWADWVSTAGDDLGADGVPAVALDSPGALYVFNHSGYATPWIKGSTPVAFESVRVACATDPPSDLFVLQPGTAPLDNPATVSLAESFATCGIDFPGDFRVVDQYPSSDPQRQMTIWRLSGH